MKKFILILIFCLLSVQTVAAEYIHIVILFDKSYENETGEILSKELNTYMNEKDYKISRIYMNCNSKCTENTMSIRFEKALRRAEDRNPDYLIIGSETLWNLYHDDIKEFRDKLKIKVGLFNMFKDSERFQFDFDFKYDGFFVDYTTVDLTTFMFYTKRNGIVFNHFYILRDESAHSLKLALYLKQMFLLEGKQPANIHIYPVSSIQSLKKRVMDLQMKPQGILIPIIKQVLDTDSKKEILETIVHHNRKHFELSVLEDDTKYLCFSLAHVVRDDYKTYKKYPQHTPEVDEINLSEFLTRYEGKKNKFVVEDTYFIMNEDRVGQIAGGYKLLKFKNDFVDFLR